MKHQFFITRSIHYLLFLPLFAACSKDVVQKQTYTPCNPCQVYKTINIDADNWLNVSKGKYQSNLYQTIREQVGSYKSISNITLINNSSQDLRYDSPIPFGDGQLSAKGTMIEYDANDHFGTQGPIPFSSLNLSVTVIE